AGQARAKSEIDILTVKKQILVEQLSLLKHAASIKGGTGTSRENRSGLFKLSVRTLSAAAAKSSTPCRIAVSRRVQNVRPCQIEYPGGADTNLGIVERR